MVYETPGVDRDPLHRSLHELLETEPRRIFPRSSQTGWKRLIAPIATFASGLTLAGMLFFQLNHTSLEQKLDVSPKKVERYTRWNEIRKDKNNAGMYVNPELAGEFSEIARFEPELIDPFAKDVMNANSSDFAKLIAFVHMYRTNSDSKHRLQVVDEIEFLLRREVVNASRINDVCRLVFPDDQKNELSNVLNPDVVQLLGYKVIAWERYCLTGNVEGRKRHLMDFSGRQKKEILEQYDRKYVSENADALLENTGDGKKFIYSSLQERRELRKFDRALYPEEQRIYDAMYGDLNNRIAEETEEEQMRLQKKLQKVSELTGASY